MNEILEAGLNLAFVAILLLILVGFFVALVWGINWAISYWEKK